MRIAIISDDSLPTSTLVHAKMLHELAVELYSNGHTPIIIAPGKSQQAHKLSVDSIENIIYWRFRCKPLRGRGKLKRAINETLLSTRAWSAIRDKLESEPFDGVVYYSPSIFFGPLVNRIKKQSSCKSYLVLRDKFPQWAVDEGLIKKGSLIEKYFRYFERINYSAADFIGLMSPKNLALFRDEYGDRFSSHVLYNWASADPLKKSKIAGIRKDLGLEDKVIFFYGGNIGHAQDMGNLVRLASAMKGMQNVHFIFLGQGDEVELVKTKIKSERLTNTTFLESVSQERYKEILTEVDVGLFSLAASHKVHNFPGKLLGYMVESIPILGSVNIGNDLIDIVNDYRAGFIFVNGQDDELLNAAKKLASCKETRLSIGGKAKELLVRQFSVKSAAIKIVNCIASHKE